MKEKSGLHLYFSNFDERYVKPFLIFDFADRKKMIQKEKRKIKKETVQEDGNNLIKTLLRVQENTF